MSLFPPRPAPTEHLINASLRLRSVVVDSREDFEQAFIMRESAMRPHTEKKWPWDEAWQRDLHATRWHEKPWFFILENEQRIGCLSLHHLPDHLRFGEFYLLKEHQSRGLGTAILQWLTRQADQHGVNMRLEYLKWNPVGSLYKRHGFIVTSENDIHFFLERKPALPSAASTSSSFCA